MDAKDLEIGASFFRPWYRGFWKDLEKIRPQLTIIRLEVVEGMGLAVMKSVKDFVEARLEKGTPLVKLERMVFEGVSEKDEGKATKL